MENLKQSIPESDPIIGIDLGTTYSAIACYRFGKVEVIADKHSERIIPSIVYYKPDTGDVKVGSAAYENSVKCPTNLLRDSKRLIGRKFDDESVKAYKNQLSKWSYKIVKGDDDEAAFEIEIAGQNVIKKPEEVSAEILKYLKSIAEERLMKKVTEAVISVPAYFSNAQKKATKKAAELAGLQVTKLITEPVAGAIYYVNDRNIESKLMVFDWGGGTLDISFIEVNNKTFEVNSVYGDTFLGGRNIDNVLVQYYQVPVQKNPEQFHRRLLNKCIKIKKELSVFPTAEHELDCYDGENSLLMNLTVEKFNELTENIMKKVMVVVKNAGSCTGWKKDDINKVLLVGGSSRIPKIRTMLENYFGKEKIYTDLHPDEAVVVGACIQAASLKQKNDLEKYKITDVTPLSIGCGLQFDLMRVIIPKNSKLPAEGKATFTTVTNNQTSFVSEIYEGERKNVKFNNLLAKYEIDGLPPKRAGEITIEDHYYLDEDGILTIKVDIPSINKTENVIITLNEFRMSQSKIVESIEDAKKMKHEDLLFKKFVYFLTQIKQYCNDILHDIDKICSEEDREFVREKCEEFIKYLYLFEFTQKDEVERKFLKLKEEIGEILLNSSILCLKI